MDFLLNIEIIIWLVLSALLIFLPLGWLTAHYIPDIKDLFRTLQEIEFPDTQPLLDTAKKIQTAASLTPQVQQDNKEHITGQEESTQTQKHEPVDTVEHDPSSQENTLDINTPTQDEPVSTEKTPISPQETTSSNDTIQEKAPPSSTQAPVKELNTDKQIKLHQKIETIKYAAMASKERGKSAQYEKKLIEGLAIDPQNIDFLNMLSTHYFETNQQIKALTLLKKVVNKEPKNHKAIRQIGQIYTSQKKFDTAQLLIEKAISLKDDHPKYYISLVEIWYETGRIQKAIQTMEKLLKLRPTNIDYLLTMATLYEEDQKPTLASKYYSKVLEVDPSNIYGKKGLKRVR